MRRNTVAIRGGRTGRVIEPLMPPDSDECKQVQGGSLQGPLHVLAEMMHLGLQVTVGGIAGASWSCVRCGVSKAYEGLSSRGDGAAGGTVGGPPPPPPLPPPGAPALGAGTPGTTGGPPRPRPPPGRTGAVKVGAKVRVDIGAVKTFISRVDWVGVLCEGSVGSDGSLAGCSVSESMLIPEGLCQ